MRRLNPPRHYVINEKDLEDLSLDDLDIRSTIDPEDVARLTKGSFMFQAHTLDQGDYDHTREYLF